ncbi:amino acid--tRNA ligase-related protein [Streptomyces sp. NPDC001922]|uniref:amino acid--tRNA ligase-related protein n=1 Tax=Streptomyces sp. NPDC001922 TaxID=3364624 RepID=UPI0036A464C4
MEFFGENRRQVRFEATSSPADVKTGFGAAISSPHRSVVSLSSAQSYQWTGRVLQSLRRSLLEHDFLEILPAILSSEDEPGARHSVAVLGDRARPKVTVEDGRVSVDGKWAYHLPVSHSVEKQMALEHADRVYCLTPCLRLLMDGEETSGKHLYTFFQLVVEWRAADADEVLTVTESILGSFARHLEPILPDEAGTASTRLKGLRSGPYPRVSFADALTLAGRKPDEPQNTDLTRDEERILTDHFTSPFWIHRYPLGVRDSLYQRGEDGLQETYDLMLPAGYGELATGGLRPRDEKEITEQSRLLGGDPNPVYAAWKERSGIQTAGFGLGLERLVRHCAGANSVLDLLAAHDSGPNRRIGAHE